MGMTSKKTELDRKCDEWIGKVGQEAECCAGNEIQFRQDERC